MDQETFNKKMDELDRKNPRPIKNFYSAERIAAIAASAAAPQVVADERAAFEATVTKLDRAEHLDRYDEQRAAWNNEQFPAPEFTPVAVGDYRMTSIQFGWLMWQARAALQAAPVQAQEPTNKGIELAIALGKAQGTLRFIATVSKDKYIAQKAMEAATALQDRAPVQPVAVPDGLTQAAEWLDAKAAKWDKESQNHLPHHNSVHAKNDLNRAAVCREYAAAIRSLAAPAAQGDAKPDSDICKNFKRRAPFVSSMLDKKIYIGYEINSEGRFTSSVVESEFLAWESRAAIAAKAAS